jgi:1,4-alpha-glucan branching enzyme
MPYVEGFGSWPFGEEWLFEAVATSYLPLLGVLDGKPVTLTVTPVLADQLDTLREGDAGDRFLTFLRETRVVVHRDDAAELDTRGEAELAAELRRAAGDYTSADARFEEIGRDVCGALRNLSGVELWTSAATHAVLPLLATQVGTALQIVAGIESHQHRFGEWGGGFWLPECAYATCLDTDLAEHSVRVFCIDQTAQLGLGSLDHLEPVATPEGVVAVPIDWQTIRLVWDTEHGYPASGEYRDYHGRTRYDLKPWNIAGKPYRHEQALELARTHAREFIGAVAERLDAYSSERGGEGLVCCALDTELLGHWWYEGPAWLAAVFEEADAADISLRTVSDALPRATCVQRELAPSTWGAGKNFSTWDSPKVAELTFTQRRAELAVVAAATRLGRSNRLERATRELLALQASDWAFQMTREQAGDYPLERASQHAAALHSALSDHGPAPDARLRGLQPRLDVWPLVLP